MAIRIVNFFGNNGVGVIAVPGLKSGDVVVSVAGTDASLGTPTGSDQSNRFAKFVQVHGELLQINASDLTAAGFMAVLQRDVVL